MAVAPCGGWGILAIVLAVLLGLMVLGVPRAEARLTSAQTSLVKGMLAVSNAKAARSSANEFSSVLLSSNTESVLTGGLSEYGSSMSDTQRGLVEIGALVDAPANRSLLTRMRAGKRLSHAQVRAAVRLLAKIDANPAVKSLLNSGKRVLKNPALLTAEVTAQTSSSSGLPGSPPSTGDQALDELSAAMVRAERTSAWRTVSAHMRSLLRGATLTAYVRTLSPLEAGYLQLLTPASDNAKVLHAHAESGSLLCTQVDPSSSPLANAVPSVLEAGAVGLLETAGEAAGIFGLSGTDVAQGLLGLASLPQNPELLEDLAPPQYRGLATELAGALDPNELDWYGTGVVYKFAARAGKLVNLAGKGLALLDSLVLGYQDGQGIAGGLGRLYESVRPSALAVTATGPPVFYADGSEQFFVEALGECPDGEQLQLGKVDATLSIAPDGSCTGSICTAITSGVHLITARYNGAEGVTTVTVKPGAVHYLDISTSPAAGVTSVQEGVQQDFSVEGRDIHNNDTGPDDEAVLSVDPAVGSCPGFGCVFTQTGQQIVTARDGSAVGYYVINVTASADTLRLTPQSNTWQVGVGNFVAVDEYNSAGQYVASVAGATLTMTPEGSCPESTCTATTPGPHTITAEYTPQGATAPITGSLVVTVLGPVDYLALTPSSSSIASGASQTYTVEGYDAANDDLGPDPNATLSISPDGSCSGYTCTPASSGDHTVTAFDGSATGQADLMVTGAAPPVVYVANTGDDSVSAIDSTTNGVIATIGLGSGASPDGVSVTPDGKFAYVSDGGTGNVSVIDTSTNSVVATIPVGGEPTGSAVTPDGAYVYVANAQGLDVTVIATSTNTIAATVPTNGADPRAVAISPDGSLAYIADGYGDDIIVVSTASNTAIDDIPLDAIHGFDAGVVVSPDGQTVWASYYDSFNLALGGIATIDTASDQVDNTYGFGDGVYGLAISPNGQNLYAAQVGGQLTALTSTPVSVVANIPSSTNGFGVASTPDGQYVYTTGPGNNVTVISTATDAVVATIPVGAGPVALAMTP